MEKKEPQMRLYGFLGEFESKFFDTKEELVEYVEKHGLSLIYVIEYLSNVAGRSDVIRHISRNGREE